MINVLIRPTLAADFDDLSAVLRQVNATDGYPVEGVEDPRSWIEVQNPIGQWTALINDRPVGHVAIVQPGVGDGAPEILRKKEQIPLTEMAVLARLFVDRSSRGNSLATQLLDAAEWRARTLGLRLVLDVMEKDRVALAIYRRRGWQELGTFDHRYGGGLRSRAVALAAR